MKYQVEHLGLAARDPVTLKDWYVTRLDGRVVYQNNEVPPAFLVELPGGLMIELYAAEKGIAETSNNRLAGWRHLALRVDSLEVAREVLAARGVVFGEPVRPAGGGGRVLFFADAEGNLLHLVERPAESLIGRSR